MRMGIDESAMLMRRNEESKIAVKEILEMAENADASTYDGFVKKSIAGAIKAKLQQGWAEYQIIEKLKSNVQEESQC